jgi:hypothetical protein
MFINFWHGAVGPKVNQVFVYSDGSRYLHNVRDIDSAVQPQQNRYLQ